MPKNLSSYTQKDVVLATLSSNIIYDIQSSF
jgi:hypothetical protein